jgi:hypothetical protein
MAATKAESAKQTTLSRLTEKFPVEVYRKNPKGFTYIPIEQVIRRFNEVLGEFWDLRIIKSEYGLTPGINYGSRNPKPGAYALVQVEIEALLDDKVTVRSGVGGDFGAADDTDKLVKTALAEAIKKAGNEFGIGLELWDEEERALIDAAQAQGLTGQVTPDLRVVSNADEDELTALKNRVADIAVAAGVDRTGPAIAAHFGVPIEALQDRETLEKLIGQQTVAV